MNAMWRDQVAALTAWLTRFPLWIVQLAFRFAMADVFFESGLLKIQSWATTLTLFRDEYKVPLLPFEWAAYLATAVELSCPIFLALGLATRLATLPMLGTTLVIQLFVYPESWNVHLMWAGALLVILTRGPGVVSLDHLIARKFLR